MKSHLDIVCDYFTQANRAFEIDEQEHACQTCVDLANFHGRLVVKAPGVPPALDVRLIIPCAVPPQRRPSVGEFCLRMNRQLRLGCFELDFDNGELCFRVITRLEKIELDVATVHDNVAVVVVAVDGLFPVIMSVLYAGMQPGLAVEQGEGFLRDMLEKLRRETES